MNMIRMFIAQWSITAAVGITTALCASLVFAPPAAAHPHRNQAPNVDYFWDGNSDADVRGILALGDADPRAVIINIINIALGFLGIIAVIIIIAAGFRYMTAGGNADARSAATGMLISGVIGLVIILSAFAIAQFLINNLVGATS